jgi:uncharacterized protein involved in exopolysaccharide biosynthesis
MEEQLTEQRANRDPEHASSNGERLIYVMPAARSDGADELDFLRLWRILWQSRWLVVAITTVVAIAAVIYALLAKQWYSAEALLIPAAPDSAQGGLAGQLGGLAGLATSLTGLSLGGADATEPLAVLESRGFTRTFIEEHKLLTVLFADEWDATTRSWKDKDPKNWPDIHDAVKYFSEDVRDIDEDKKTGLITVTITWTDREIAARWANLLVKDLNSRMRQRALSEAETNLEYLKREMNSSSLVTMQESIGRLLETELQKVMLAKGKEEFAFRTVDAAAPPKWRARPKRAQVVALAIAFGLILGVVVAFVRQAVRDNRTAGDGPVSRDRDQFVASGPN